MKKQFLSIILTLTIVLSLLPFGTFSITANAETVFTEGDFECTVLDGIVGITDYFGTADSVEIPSTLGGYTITVIGAGAFENCTTLANITIPQGFTDIGENAFYNTAYYNNPDNWEDGILYIGEYLIAAKHTNTSCNIKEGTKVIAVSTFRNSANIRGVVIPNSITKIPGDAFYDCINLRYVKIPDSVKYIDCLAFYNCSSLASVTIPESVEYMGDAVFGGCDSLSVLNYNAIDCKPIGEGEEYGIFANCSSIKQINFGNKVKNIPEYAFLRCTSLENLTIPNSVTNIGKYAFYECEYLENATIGNSVTHIGEYAFYKCGYLENVILGNSVTHIDDCAFARCNNLKSAKIPKSLTTIGIDALNSRESLYITDLKSWCNINTEDVFSATKLYLNNKLVTDLVIPYGITEIRKYAFSNFSSIKTVVIPNSVTTIGFAAFSSCTGLKQVKIPNSVTYIDSCAFAECTSLESIKLPNSITTINKNTFFLCSNLKSIEIPSGVTEIKGYAFYDCTALKNVYFTGTKTAWNNITVGIQNTPLANAKVYFNKSMPIPIASAKVSGIKTKTYSGKTIKQSIKVKLDGKTLKSGTDYTVSYKNNKNIGTATLTIKGKGKYSGTLQKTFTIKPKTTKIKTFKSPKKKQAKVSWSKDSKVSGYQIVYARNSRFTKGKNRVSVKGYKTTSKTIKKLKSKKTYYVKVRSYKTVKGKKIYSSYSKVKKIKIK